MVETSIMKELIPAFIAERKANKKIVNEQKNVKRYPSPASNKTINSPLYIKETSWQSCYSGNRPS